MRLVDISEVNNDGETSEVVLTFEVDGSYIPFSARYERATDRMAVVFHHPHQQLAQRVDMDELKGAKAEVREAVMFERDARRLDGSATHRLSVFVGDRFGTNVKGGAA